MKVSALFLFIYFSSPLSSWSVIIEVQYKKLNKLNKNTIRKIKFVSKNILDILRLCYWGFIQNTKGPFGKLWIITLRKYVGNGK